MARYTVLIVCCAVLLAPLALDAAEAPRPAPPAARRPAPARTPPRPGLLPNTPAIPPEKLPADYYAAIGQVYLRYQQWDKAEEAYEQAYEKEKDAGRKADHAYNLAQLLMRKKENDKALPLLQEAIDNAPKRTSPYQIRRYRQALAALYEDAKQPDKAEALYREWLGGAKTDYERASAQREYLGFLQRAGKLDEAIAGFEAALKEKPGDKQTLEVLRLIYSSIKPDPKKSLELSQKILEADPGNRDAALQLVSAHERAREYGKAIELLKGLLEKDPKDSGGYLTSRLVHLYTVNGQKDEALALAGRMLEQGPKSSYLHSRVASIYQRLGKADEAIEQYEAAAAIAKTDPEKERYLLSVAFAARRAEKYDKAEKAIRRLIQSNSKSTVAQAKRLLFEIYEEQNKLDQLQVKPGEKKGPAPGK
jgi:tetratricopeptide (TPR) repeat protein